MPTKQNSELRAVSEFDEHNLPLRQFSDLVVVDQDTGETNVATSFFRKTNSEWQEVVFRFNLKIDLKHPISFTYNKPITDPENPLRITEIVPDERKDYFPIGIVSGVGRGNNHWDLAEKPGHRFILGA